MGRPKGIKEIAPRQTAARKQADLAASQGITPLNVMLTTMRRQWSLAQKHEADNNEARAEAYYTAATRTAAEAAPFVHARLANTNVNATIRRHPSEFTDEELDLLSGGIEGEGEKDQRAH